MSDTSGIEAKQLLPRPGGDQTARLMEILPQPEILPSQPSRIAMKAKGKILFIDPAEVTAVEAQGNYVLLRTQKNSYLLRESISMMAEKLQRYGFIRIHRSVLVNVSYVQEIQPYSTGEYVLRLRADKEYSVSRTYRKNLGCIAQCWLGTNEFIGE